jgi:hypothetical protein
VRDCYCVNCVATACLLLVVELPAMSGFGKSAFVKSREAMTVVVEFVTVKVVCPIFCTSWIVSVAQR